MSALSINDVVLKRGAHRGSKTPTDHPECVCPVLAEFGRIWNDGIPDDETRTRLLMPFAERLIGTRSTPEVEDARAFLAADWLVRTYTPAWLRAAGLTDTADGLAALPPLMSAESAAAALPVIRLAHVIAAAAARPAGPAALEAARTAIKASAARAAWKATEAAWEAREAAWEAAEAAWGTAMAAAMAAVLAAAVVGEEAAIAATVEQLQASAVDLFHRMIEVTA